MTSRLARITESSPEPQTSKTASSVPSLLKHDAPWRRVVLRRLKPSMTLADVQRRMGWGEGSAYQRRKHSHLRLQVAAQMGMALEVRNLGAFLVELAEEEGIPPLYLRVIHKPNLQKQALEKSRAKKCQRCGKPGCTQDRCQAAVSPEVAVLNAKADAAPMKRRRKASRARGGA